MPSRTQRNGITARAVAIGLLLIPLNAWWLAQIEYVRYSDNATTSALFFNCIAVLLVLLGLSRLLMRLKPRWALTRGEILTVYIMLVVASALGGHDQLQILFTTITWVFRNATPENAWAEELHPHIPEHLTVSDPLVLERLYLGDASIYAPGRLSPWLGPLAWWTLFACLLVWTLYCLMCIFRRQWDRERLNYPITQPPLEVTKMDGPMLPSSLFWVAFALAAAVQLVRLAHNLWPAVPALNIGVHNYRFRGLPLSAAGAIPISSYPFSYGMAYLLPLQLAFSVWFFFFFARLEMVVAAMFGHTQWRGFPYIQEQGVGAYIGVACFVVWAARRHLGRVWRSALGAGRYDDEGEPLPAPLAVWGFIVGAAGLIGFSVTAGMSLLAAVCFFAIFLTIVLTLTRLRAELGLPTIELYQVGADDILQNIAGGAAWSARDLSVMSLYFWLVRTHRQLPMPAQADCLRIGDQAGLRLRGLSPVILGASALGIVAAFWALLHVTYQTGYETAKFTGPAGWAFGNAPWQKLDAWLTNPRTPQYAATGGYVYGIAFTLVLAAMRTRFVWWPFHPVGYLVSGSFGLFRLWLPIFLTWLIKSLLLRYGGLPAYRRARPFFFGLIFGEFTAAFARTVLDLIFELRLPPASGVGGL
ncbi:MAG: DUF6785 family protein [Armatimonadota bacterium]